jgi:hypothetical protein
MTNMGTRHRLRRKVVWGVAVIAFLMSGADWSRLLDGHGLASVADTQSNPAPVLVSAQAEGTKNIRIAWTYNGSATQGFEVQHKLGNGAFEKAGSPKKTKRDFLDTKLKPGTYTYRVRAKFSRTVFSDFSNEMSATVGIPPTPPGVFTLNAPTPSCSGTSRRVSLSWGASPGATNYNVQRKLASSSTWGTVTSTTSTSHVDSSGLADSTAYHYRIQATNSVGSSLSNVQNATTPSCNPPPGAFTQN